MGKKQKFYVVWKGREPGIYRTWTDCQTQIDGFTDAQFRSFATLSEAEAAYAGTPEEAADAAAANKSPSKSTKKAKASPDSADIIWESISVDAACAGNPGVLEYQGVDTATGEPLFHQGPFEEGTVNIGEFLAIVHGLALLKGEGSDRPIYSDSRTAMTWLRRGAANTKLEKNARNRKLFELLARAERWLANNTYSNEVLKWQTKDWGEIPADFGRK